MLSKTKLFAFVFLSLLAIQTIAQQQPQQQLPVEITNREYKKAIYIYSDSLAPTELLIGKGYAVIADLQVKIPANPQTGAKEQIQKGRETIALVDQEQKPIKGKVVWITTFNEWGQDKSLKEENESWPSKNVLYIALGLIIILLIYLLMRKNKS